MHPIGGARIATLFFGMYMKSRTIYFLLRFLLPAIFGVFMGTSPTYADNSHPSNPKKEEGKGSDPRLPPVLPGESIETESGEKMNVWSTSGAVVALPPAAPQLPSVGGNPLGGSQVIIDGRGRSGQRPDLER